MDGASRVPFTPGVVGTASPNAVGGAQAAALAAIDSGRVHARGRDHVVFEVLRYAVERLESGDEGAEQASNLVLRILGWDRLDPNGADSLIKEVVEIVPALLTDDILPD